MSSAQVPSPAPLESVSPPGHTVAMETLHVLVDGTLLSVSEAADRKDDAVVSLRAWGLDSTFAHDILLAEHRRRAGEESWADGLDDDLRSNVRLKRTSNTDGRVRTDWFTADGTWISGTGAENVGFDGASDWVNFSL